MNWKRYTTVTHDKSESKDENAHTAKTSHYKILSVALLTFYSSVAACGRYAPPEELRPKLVSVYTGTSKFFR